MVASVIYSASSEARNAVTYVPWRSLPSKGTLPGKGFSSVGSLSTF